MRLTACGSRLHTESLQLAALLLDLDLQCGSSLCHHCLLLSHGVERLGQGRNFVEPGPAYGIVPRASYAPVAIEHRSRGSVLALKGVPDVQAPQPPVVEYPV